MLKDKQQQQHSLKTQQTSEPDSDAVEILELSEQEFKTTMINKRANGKGGSHARTDE